MVISQIIGQKQFTRTDSLLNNGDKKKSLTVRISRANGNKGIVHPKIKNKYIQDAWTHSVILLCLYFKKV